MAQTRLPLNRRLMTHSTRGFHVKIRLRGPTIAKISETCHFQLFLLLPFKDGLRLRSHRETFNIDILAQKIRSQYTCGQARKKFWDKKSMLSFSRQAHNGKVTDCHALFRILWFFGLVCFLSRNVDLGGSFPTHDLKFGQFCDSKMLLEFFRNF